MARARFGVPLSLQWFLRGVGVLRWAACRWAMLLAMCSVLQGLGSGRRVCVALAPVFVGVSEYTCLSRCWALALGAACPCAPPCKLHWQNKI